MTKERPDMSINAFGLWYFTYEGQMHFSTPDLDMRASLPIGTDPDEVTPAHLSPC
jgi:hypothetical protein